MRTELSGEVSSVTVVVGVGNIILSDDGLGVPAVKMIECDPRLPASVQTLDGGTLGLELLPYLSDASRILFLDAMNTGAPAGTITRMTATDLAQMTRGFSVHQLGVADLIAALPLVCSEPQEILVFGLQPVNTDWGTSLSPEVEMALPSLVEAALAQLQVWESQHAGIKSNLPSFVGRCLAPEPSQPCNEGDWR